MIKKLLPLLLVLSLLACSGQPAATQEPAQEPAAVTEPTAIPASPTPTTSPTPKPTATATPEPTPTKISVSAADHENALKTYKTVLVIYMDSYLLNETAKSVASGELEGIAGGMALLLAASFVNAVEESLPNVTPPTFMADYWAEAKAAHDQTKNQIAHWYNKETDSAGVKEKMSSVMADLEALLTQIEKDLMQNYGFTADEFLAVRAEVAEAFEEVASGENAKSSSDTSSSLEVSSHQQYMDGDYYKIIGEVKNLSSQPMEFVKVVATLYDDSGKMTGSEFTYMYRDVIPAGEKAPFEISTDEWTGTTNYKLQVQGSSGNSPDIIPEILSHQSYENGNYYTIIGEVLNTADQPIGFVKVIATLYDDEDQVVGVDFTYAYLDAVSPQGKTPFELSTNHWEGAVRYELAVQASAADTPAQNLVVLSHDALLSGSRLTVTGEVQNNGTSDAEFVKLVITLYDAAGQVVGIGYTYTTLDKVPAGGTSPFETTVESLPGYDHYEIQVQK